MLKKYGFTLLIAVLIIQLLVPLGMVISTVAINSQTKKYGTEYKISLKDLWFDNDEGYLEFEVLVEGYDNPYLWRYDNIQFLSVSQGENGFAVLTPASKEHKNSSYIKNKREDSIYYFPASRFHIGKPKKNHTIWLAFLPDLTDDFDENIYSGVTLVYYSEAYMECYVYNGKIIVKDVYIDGVPAMEFFKTML